MPALCIAGSNVILKTNQSQFLVTEDYRIVANDLDDLPEVIPDNLPNCTWGKVEDRDPSFQSPEEKSYSPNDPSPFTDKADVWKLVNMTKFIMYKVSVHIFYLYSVIAVLLMQHFSMPMVPKNAL